MIGGEGNGWKVALTTLMNERAGLGFNLQVRLRQTLDELIEAAAGDGGLEDSALTEPLGQLQKCLAISAGICRH